MTIERIEASVFRAPVPRPVATSFGVMRNRPAVFVRLTDKDGAFGWGEVFANWPSAGAEHRAHLLMEDIADLVLGFRTDAPGALWTFLTEKTHVRALQSGEWGPFAQVIAGLDTAMHDLAARKAGVPLARMLSEGAAAYVPVYASGIHVSAARDAIQKARAEGTAAFKVKVGFDFEKDLAALRDLAGDVRAGERLFADANQAWDLPQALEFVKAAAGTGLGWIEEPILADRPEAEWTALAEASAIPIAGGENIAGDAAFTAASASGYFSYLQPDVAKWGGVSGCFRVARQALSARLAYCPHFLGGGIGLLASAHLLAAAGGPGLLEVDANPNPLRDAFFPDGAVRGGHFALSAAAGLGIEDLPEDVARYRTLALDSRTRV